MVRGDCGKVTAPLRITALGNFVNDGLGLNCGPDHRHGRRGTGKSLRFYLLGKVGPEGQAVLAFARILDHDTGGRFVIRISWLLVSYLAAAMVSSPIPINRTSAAAP
jgi:hypothetical protein